MTSSAQKSIPQPFVKAIGSEAASVEPGPNQRPQLEDLGTLSVYLV